MKYNDWVYKPMVLCLLLVRKSIWLRQVWWLLLRFLTPKSL